MKMSFSAPLVFDRYPFLPDESQKKIAHFFFISAGPFPTSFFCPSPGSPLTAVLLLLFPPVCRVRFARASENTRNSVSSVDLLSFAHNPTLLAPTSWKFGSAISHTYFGPASSLKQTLVLAGQFFLLPPLIFGKHVSPSLFVWRPPPLFFHNVTPSMLAGAVSRDSSHRGVLLPRPTNQ